MESKIYVESCDIKDFLLSVSKEINGKTFVLAENNTYKILADKTKSGFSFSAYNEDSFIESTCADTYRDCEVCLEILYSKYIDEDYLVDDKAAEDLEYEKSDAMILAFIEFLNAMIGDGFDAAQDLDSTELSFMIGDTVDFLWESYGIG